MVWALSDRLSIRFREAPAAQAHACIAVQPEGRIDEIVVFVHVMSVVLAFGPTFAYPVFLSVAERTDVRAMPVVAKGIEAWDRFAIPLIAVIIASGIYLVIDRWSFADFYVIWGLAVILLLAALAVGFLMPRARRVEEIVERDIARAGDGEIELSDEYRALDRQISMVAAASWRSKLSLTPAI